MNCNCVSTITNGTISVTAPPTSCACRPSKTCKDTHRVCAKCLCCKRCGMQLYSTPLWTYSYTTPNIQPPVHVPAHTIPQTPYIGDPLPSNAPTLTWHSYHHFQ
jgi:hypothetical protein